MRHQVMSGLLRFTSHRGRTLTMRITTRTTIPVDYDPMGPLRAIWAGTKDRRRGHADRIGRIVRPWLFSRSLPRPMMIAVAMHWMQIVFLDFVELWLMNRVMIKTMKNGMLTSGCGSLSSGWR
ncbi:hypothetical protein M378DRAFT_653968 [Amanita muscaria Koide BX008]|uniref:Uncharacterized protein n=1 Tax=Amanita muscaria (strain Koide BX008) TaxID=946122 RepID=A0A0C2X3A3_AMAMK|nr:hypothetical protein M378DRAFT_653968 [Amanita muscaria Koide BX008]